MRSRVGRRWGMNDQWAPVEKSVAFNVEQALDPGWNSEWVSWGSAVASLAMALQIEMSLPFP